MVGGQEISSPLWIAFMDLSVAALPVDPFLPPKSAGVLLTQRWGCPAVPSGMVSGPSKDCTRSFSLVSTSQPATDGDP